MEVKFTSRNNRNKIKTMKPALITKPYLRLTAALVMMAFVAVQCGIGIGYANGHPRNLRIKQAVIDEKAGATGDAIGKALSVPETAGEANAAAQEPDLGLCVTADTLLPVFSEDRSQKTEVRGQRTENILLAHVCLK